MWKLYIKKVIKQNKRSFDKRLYDIIKEKKESRKIQLCSQAAIFAVNNPCGILNSTIIESTLVNIAEKFSVELSKEYQQHSFLHVMTRAYSSGGHTRVCERWIEHSDAIEKHSIALISQDKRNIPPLFIENVKNRNGIFTQVIGSSALEKAINLRKIASNYKYIILYTHAYDIVPLLAFGTKEFKRPVILYNHADSWFWLGISIADLVISFRSFDIDINKKYRDIQNNYLLPLPIRNPKSFIYADQCQSKIKEELGVGKNDHVILTMASSYKYKKFNNLDFIHVMKDVLSENPNSVLLAIGPSNKEKEWSEAISATNGRVNAIGVIANEDVEKYFSIVDIAINSFPLSSPTGLLDIAKYGIPCLSLELPCSSLDTIDASDIVCVSTQHLKEEVSKLLAQRKVQKKFQFLLKRDHLPEGFKKQLKRCVKQFPKHHAILKFKQDGNREATEFEIWIAANIIEERKSLKQRFRVHIRFFVYWYVKFLYPFGMNSRFYNFLTSFGIL